MKRLALLPFFVVLTACPGDKQPQRAAAISIDSAPPPADTAQRDTAPRTDLSSIKASTPAAAPDTFHRRKLVPSGTERSSGAASGLPSAPQPLLDAVEREQSVSQFCFIEFGKKSDPGLRGNVTMAVSVGGSGINDAHVASSAWSGPTGTDVNRCLNERAKRAWKLAPGAVKPGRYSVQLTFAGS